MKRHNVMPLRTRLAKNKKNVLVDYLFVVTTLVGNMSFTSLAAELHQNMMFGNGKEDLAIFLCP